VRGLVDLLRQEASLFKYRVLLLDIAHFVYIVPITLLYVYSLFSVLYNNINVMRYNAISYLYFLICLHGT
jgi:hypothetical protein